MVYLLPSSIVIFRLCAYVHCRLSAALFLRLLRLHLQRYMTPSRYSMRKADFDGKFYIRTVPGDGNCFYHALYQCLSNECSAGKCGARVLRIVSDKANYVRNLRRLAADEILAHSADYQPFLASSVRVYCRGVLSNAWGDFIVATALSRALGLALYIVTINSRDLRNYATFQLCREDSPPLPAVHLVFTGAPDAGHYDALVRVERSPAR